MVGRTTAVHMHRTLTFEVCPRRCKVLDMCAMHSILELKLWHPTQTMCHAVRHRKLKVGVAVSSMVVLGGGLPFVVAWWHQKKAGLPFPPPTSAPSPG